MHVHVDITGYIYLGMYIVQRLPLNAPRALKRSSSALNSLPRRFICHKHHRQYHKQRLCKIISTQLKFYFVITAR